MPAVSEFFETQSEQSSIKAILVTSYFGAWANVIKRGWDSSLPIGYIDLFCGPGVYQDGNESVPIKLIRSILADEELSRRMILAFNDESPENIESLKKAIKAVDVYGKLNGRIKFSNQTVDNDFYKKIKSNSNIPILSFIDPFGYKGITRSLISTLIQNNGSDCIFFFNYSRINMALSSNTKFDIYLSNIFGEDRMEELKKVLPYHSPQDREPIVIGALTEALKETRATSILPFKFYNNAIKRTSHYIIFVSKHQLACKIMKNIMYNISAKDTDGIALFELHDQINFGDDNQQIPIFNTPFQALCDELVKNNKGKTILVKDLCKQYDINYNNRFVGKNVKHALNCLEDQGGIVVTGRKRRPAKGKKTMPDTASVTFK
jgi:three-Cys-motif partner protein